jgi:hypothetical protein
MAARSLALLAVSPSVLPHCSLFSHFSFSGYARFRLPSLPTPIVRHKVIASRRSTHRTSSVSGTASSSASPAPRGAIASSGGLGLFKRREAKDGGDFAFAGPALASFVAFSQCRAQEAGAATFRRSQRVMRHSTQLSASTLSNTVDLFGTPYRQSGGLLAIKYSNFSHSQAVHCVGCLGAKVDLCSFASFTMEICLFERSTAVC